MSADETLSVVRDHGDALTTIRNIAYSIESLAESFYLTGNPVVSDRLRDQAGFLLDAAEASGSAFNELLFQQIHGIQLHENAMVAAICAAAVKHADE